MKTHQIQKRIPTTQRLRDANFAKSEELVCPSLSATTWTSSLQSRGLDSYSPRLLLTVISFQKWTLECSQHAYAISQPEGKINIRHSISSKLEIKSTNQEKDQFHITNEKSKVQVLHLIG